MHSKCPLWISSNGHSMNPSGMITTATSSLSEPRITKFPWLEWNTFNSVIMIVAIYWVVSKWISLLKCFIQVKCPFIENEQHKKPAKVKSWVSTYIILKVGKNTFVIMKVGKSTFTLKGIPMRQVGQVTQPAIEKGPLVFSGSWHHKF